MKSKDEKQKTESTKNASLGRVLKKNKKIKQTVKSAAIQLQSFMPPKSSLFSRGPHCPETSTPCPAHEP